MLEAVNGQIVPRQKPDFLGNQYQALVEIAEAIAVHRDLDELFQDLAQRLPRIVPFDYINLVLHDPARDVMRLHLLVAPEPSTIRPGLELPIDESPGGLVWKTQQAVCWSRTWRRKADSPVDAVAAARTACNPSAWSP